MKLEAAIREAVAAEPDRDAVARLSELIGELSGGATAVPHRTNRRIWAPILAAAAVVALVTGGLLAAAHWPKDDTANGIAAAPLTAAELRPVWKFSVSGVPGYTITRTSILRIDAPSDESQAAVITAVARPGPRGTFVLTLSPDDFDAAAKGISRPVTVGRYPGLFFPGRHVDAANLAGRSAWNAAQMIPDDMPRLMWKYPDGSFGSIIGTFGFDPKTYDYDNSAALRILTKFAAAVRTDVREPVRMPFTLTDPPSNLSPESVGDVRACLGYGTGVSSNPGSYLGDWVGSVMTVCRVQTGASRAATLASARITEAQTASTTVRDLPDGTSLIIEVDQGQQRLVSQQQAAHLAATADVSPRLEDPSTWLVVR